MKTEQPYVVIKKKASRGVVNIDIYNRYQHQKHRNLRIGETAKNKILNNLRNNLMKTTTKNTLCDDFRFKKNNGIIGGKQTCVYLFSMNKEFSYFKRLCNFVWH